MLVNYVWPFREVPGSTERKTFFWLECNYEEAVEVLHQVKLSADDFRLYVEHLARFQSEDHEHRFFGKDLDVYSRIGFLISEDGKSVEWAPPGFPISNQWNAYNPFQEIETLFTHDFSKFRELRLQFEREEPWFSMLSSRRKIPSRFDLSRFQGERAISSFQNLLSSSESNEIAVKLFNDRYCKGAEAGQQQVFSSDFESQALLAQRYLLLQRTNLQKHNITREQAAHLNLSELDLSEWFARKTRAVANLRIIENRLNGEGGSEKGYPNELLQKLSDDELCELMLLLQSYPASDAIKWIYGEFESRLFYEQSFETRPPHSERAKRHSAREFEVIVDLEPPQH